MTVPEFLAGRPPARPNPGGWEVHRRGADAPAAAPWALVAAGLPEADARAEIDCPPSPFPPGEILRLRPAPAAAPEGAAAPASFWLVTEAGGLFRLPALTDTIDKARLAWFYGAAAARGSDWPAMWAELPVGAWGMLLAERGLGPAALAPLAGEFARRALAHLSGDGADALREALSAHLVRAGRGDDAATRRAVADVAGRRRPSDRQPSTESAVLYALRSHLGERGAPWEAAHHAADAAGVAPNGSGEWARQMRAEGDWQAARLREAVPLGAVLRGLSEREAAGAAAAGPEIVSVSGGRDSVATLLLTLSAGRGDAATRGSPPGSPGRPRGG